GGPAQRARRTQRARIPARDLPAVPHHRGRARRACALRGRSDLRVQGLLPVAAVGLHASRTSNSSFERRQIQITVTSVSAPPKITDGTVPISFAASPDSNAPSSFDVVTKMLFTDCTRPRR